MFVATLISFLFFAATVREQPFEQQRLNIIKTFSEFQVFGVLLVCIIVQTHEQGFATEVLDIDDYGTLQSALTLAALPVTGYFLLRSLRDMHAQAKTDLSILDATRINNPILDEEDNPMFGGDSEPSDDKAESGDGDPNAHFEQGMQMVVSTKQNVPVRKTQKVGSDHVTDLQDGDSFEIVNVVVDASGTRLQIKTQTVHGKAKVKKGWVKPLGRDGNSLVVPMSSRL